MENIKEEWKDIKGYEGIYQVSNLGKVKSLDRIIKYSNGKSNHTKGKILNGYDNSNGYWYVDLYGHDKKRRKKSVHILVAETFIDNPDNLPCVNHKDENTYNNKYYNLEWCTYKYNNNYGSHAEKSRLSHIGKNTGKDNVNSKKVICITTGKVFDCIKQASEYYHIENLRSHISSFCNGNRKNFKYIGKLEDGTKLTWMYYENYLNLCNNTKEVIYG